jgi:hypothetical protein
MTPQVWTGTQDWNGTLECVVISELDSWGVSIDTHDVIVPLLRWCHLRRFQAPIPGDSEGWSFAMVTHHWQVGLFSPFSVWHSGSDWGDRTPVLQLHLGTGITTTRRGISYQVGLPVPFTQRRRDAIRQSVNAAMRPHRVKSTESPEIKFKYLRDGDRLASLLQAYDRKLYGIR